jgi:oligoribonuclease NrnB/cAMP/cGMP phosphodiesterase (DHH superfamily)
MSDAYTYTSLLTEPPAKKALCIYHANCLDGFGSAWAVWKRFGSKDFTYHAGNYSVPPPDVSQRDVFMVDFSYKRDVVAEMIESAKSVHLIDHHISALNDLQGLAGLNQHNSTIEQSGCMLTWQLFHGDTVPVPELLWYIQDRDLWRFELPHCRELTMALLSYDFDFTVWDELNERPIADLIMEGAAIRRKHNRDLKSLLKSKPLMLTIGGYYGSSS